MSALRNESVGSGATPFAIFAAFVLLVWGGLAAELQDDYRRTLAAAEGRLATRSYLIGEWIIGAFQGADYVLRDLAGHVAPRELAFPPPPRRVPEIATLLAAKQQTVAGAYLAGFFDPDCRVVHATLPMAGFDASHRDYCQAFQRDPALETYVSPMYLGNVGRLNVTQARIIRFPDGSRAGLVAFAIDLDFFDAWLARAVGTGHGVVAVVDTNLALLARRPAMPAALGKPAVVPGLAEFVASGRDVATALLDSQVDGISRLYSARKVGQLPFVAVAGEDRDEVLAPWYRKLWIYLAAGAAISLLAFAALRHHRWRLRNHQELARLAATDHLTGVANRRHFLVHLQLEFTRSRRLGRPFGLLILDIDLFKPINDRYGHLVGDDAIRAVMHACRGSIREIDFLGRIGGEEFAVLLPETDLAEARVAAERIRLAVAQTDFRGEGSEPIPLTVSIGVTEPAAADSEGLNVLGRADKALYDAKRSGRNCVCSRSALAPGEVPAGDTA